MLTHTKKQNEQFRGLTPPEILHLSNVVKAIASIERGLSLLKYTYENHVGTCFLEDIKEEVKNISNIIYEDEKLKYSV